MHWSLDQVRDLTMTEFRELKAWAKDRANRAAGEESIDLDEVIAEKLAKERAPGE